MRKVRLSENVTRIEVSAFSNCTGLQEIFVPDSVTEICIEAFYNCSALTELTIPKTVTDIGERAFTGTQILFTVTPGSYAEEYMIINNLPYKYETDEEKTSASQGEVSPTEIPAPGVTSAPTPASNSRINIAVAWNGTKGYLQGELYVEVEETVTLQIEIAGVEETAGFTVEIRDNYGNLIKTISNEAFQRVGDSFLGAILSHNEKLCFMEAGTVDYIVICTDDGTVETARVPRLYVRYKNAGNLEQLKDYAGVSLENFIEGNPMVVQCDNGLSVDGKLYNEYSYSEDGVTRYFFVNASDKSLVTDYEVLQKLWYSMMEGLGAYHAGGALSTVVVLLAKKKKKN